MLEQKDLQAIAELLTPIHETLASLDARVGRLEEDIEILKEDSAITRTSVNTLLDWAEAAQVQVRIPLFRKAD